MGLTHNVQLKLSGLSEVEVGGIPGVAVKCVEIGRNTSGEGAQNGESLTGQYRAELCENSGVETYNVSAMLKHKSIEYI